MLFAQLSDARTEAARIVAGDHRQERIGPGRLVPFGRYRSLQDR